MICRFSLWFYCFICLYFAGNCYCESWLVRNEGRIQKAGGCIEESDIVCSQNGKKLNRLKRDITPSEVDIVQNKPWTLPIPYEIGETIAPVIKTIIQDLLAYLATVTCLRFEEGVNITGKAHILFYGPASGGCSTPVDSIGVQSEDKHTIILSPACSRYYSVAHEVLHALGFLHEQNRPDRNRYVQIMLNNVRKEKETNYDDFFAKHYSLYDMTKYEYDERSLMHYGIDDGAYINGVPVIIPLSRFINPFLMGANRKVLKEALKYYSYKSAKGLERSEYPTQNYKYGFSNLDIKKLNDIYCAKRLYASIPQAVPAGK